MRVLFDTVTYVRSIACPQDLPRKVLSILEDDESQIHFSTISLLELGVKSARGISPLTMKQARQGVEDLRLKTLPYLAEHAYRLFALPVHHKDPFDRVLIAQALAENIPVVTPDEQFSKYRGLKVLWR